MNNSTSVLKNILLENLIICLFIIYDWDLKYDCKGIWYCGHGCRCDINIFTSIIWVKKRLSPTRIYIYILNIEI